LNLQVADSLVVTERVVEVVPAVKTCEAVGAVVDAVGGVVSETPFDTVTLTAPESVMFPAASLALAVIECEALVADVVFQVME